MSVRVLSELLPNGQVDPGEGVVLALCLQHEDYEASDPLLGTLAPSPDVLQPGPPQWYGSLTTAEVVCRAFPLRVQGTCGVPTEVTLSIGVPGVGLPRDVRFRVPVGPVVFAEDFDATSNFDVLPAGWIESFSGYGNWGLGWSDETSPLRVNAAMPPWRSDSRLDSPPFVVPAGASILSFRHRYKTEAYYDGGVVEIAIAGGPFEDVIAAGGEFITGAYREILRGAPPGPFKDGPLAGRWAWTGDSNGTLTTLIRLPRRAANQTVQLRWRAGSDDVVYAGMGSGWWIDTIHVTSETCLGSVPSDVPWGLQSVVRGHELSLAWHPPLVGHPSGYRLEGSLDGGATFPLALDVGPVTGVTLTGPDLTADIRVRALTASGPSGPSDTTRVELGAVAPPGAPRNLLASVDGFDVGFAWEHATSGGALSRLTLEVGSGPGLADLAVLPLSVESSSFHVAGAPPGTYYARLRPVGPRMIGPPSNELTIVVPGTCAAPSAPVFIAAAQSATTGLSTVQWHLPAIGTPAPLGWYLQAGSAPGLVDVAQVVTSQPVVAAAAPAGTYHLRVLAANWCGVSTPSPSVVLTVR